MIPLSNCIKKDDYNELASTLERRQATGNAWYSQVEAQVRQWFKPAPERQITGVVTDLLRSKPELIAENAFLRQQVIVLKRQHSGRLPITPHDRRVLVGLASRLDGWKDALHLVEPDTVRFAS